MRYQVPQFIEIEDKVIGPLTVKQFVYLAGGAGLCFIIYTYLPLIIALPLVVGMAALAGALAFYKVNNKPFVDFLESMFTYYTKERLYIWRKEQKPIETPEEKQPEATQIYVPKLSDSRLKELSWSLDINENLNPLTGIDGKTTK